MEPPKKSVGEIIETTVVAYGEAAAKTLAPVGRVAEVIAFQALTIFIIIATSYVAVWGFQSGSYVIAAFAALCAVSYVLKEIEYKGDMSRFWWDASSARR